MPEQNGGEINLEVSKLPDLLLMLQMSGEKLSKVCATAEQWVTKNFCKFWNTWKYL